jgi:hypothetical protein
MQKSENQGKLFATLQPRRNQHQEIFAFDFAAISEYIIKCWHNEPKRFIVNPIHHKVGLNN